MTDLLKAEQISDGFVLVELVKYTDLTLTVVSAMRFLSGHFCQAE